MGVGADAGKVACRSRSFELGGSFVASWRQSIEPVESPRLNATDAMLQSR